VNSPWVVANPATFGRPTGTTNFGTPRTIVMSAGFRF